MRWLGQLRVHIQADAQINKRAEVIQEAGTEGMRAHEQLVDDLRSRVAHLWAGMRCGSRDMDSTTPNLKAPTRSGFSHRLIKAIGLTRRTLLCNNN